MAQTYIEACLNDRNAFPSADAWIERWHEGDVGADLELHEFLGMTFQEYGEWVVNPLVLELILKSRTDNLPYEEVRARSNLDNQLK